VGHAIALMELLCSMKSVTSSLMAVLLTKKLQMELKFASSATLAYFTKRRLMPKAGVFVKLAIN